PNPIANPAIPAPANKALILILIDSKIMTIIMKYTVYVSVLFNSIFIVFSLFSFIFIGLLLLDLKILSISRFPILIIINATIKITMILITLFNIVSQNSGPVNVSNHLFIVFDNI